MPNVHRAAGDAGLRRLGRTTPAGNRNQPTGRQSGDRPWMDREPIPLASDYGCNRPPRGKGTNQESAGEPLPVRSRKVAGGVIRC